MLTGIFRVVAIGALMAAIILAWADWETLREEQGNRVFALAGGASLAALGVLYKLLGSWDLIPDWIPLLGRVDDFAASLVVLAGLGVAATAWYLL